MQDKMAQCPKCSHNIQQGRARCLYCGAPISAPSQEGPPKEIDIELLLEGSPNVSFGATTKTVGRNIPMRGPVQLLAFLSAVALGGFLVWLLM
jgi:hypothetical protein